MEKYKNIVEIINSSIRLFNGYFKENYQFEELDISQFCNQKYFYTIKNNKEINLSQVRNCGVPGVYFLFGFHIDNPSKIAVYVGKASLNSNTGARLVTYFKPKDMISINGDLFYKKDNYAIEYLTLIPFDDYDIYFLSAALEEFLLTRLSEDINLINKIY